MYYNYDEQRYVLWEYNKETGQLDGPVLARIKGDDVVLVKLNGEFITYFPGGRWNKKISAGKVVD